MRTTDWHVITVLSFISQLSNRDSRSPPSSPSDAIPPQEARPGPERRDSKRLSKRQNQPPGPIVLSPSQHAPRPDPTPTPPSEEEDDVPSPLSINTSPPSSPNGNGNGYNKRNSRPLSLVQTHRPHMMDVNASTPPELQPIFSFLNAHSNKLYQEGYFLKLDDQDLSEKPEAPEPPFAVVC